MTFKGRVVVELTNPKKKKKPVCFFTYDKISIWEKSVDDTSWCQMPEFTYVRAWAMYFQMVRISCYGGTEKLETRGLSKDR